MTQLTTESETARLDRDPYLDALIEESSTHRALHHPWLGALAGGALPDPEWALRDFAWQYYGYSSEFPAYLRAVIDHLPRLDHKQLLRKNLEEEQGDLDSDEAEELRAVGIEPESVAGVPHPVLFRRFCTALGISDAALARPGEAGQRWQRRFTSYLQAATPAAAVGALGLGTENVVRPLYRQILTGIEQTNLSRADYVFFELHCVVDDQHQLDLYSIARDLAQTPRGRRDLRAGMLTALELRAEFWDHLYSRAFTGKERVA